MTDIKYTMTPDELKDFLRTHQLSNDSFADLIEVTKPAVDHWTTGRRNVPASTVKLINFFKQYPYMMSVYKEC